MGFDKEKNLWFEYVALENEVRDLERKRAVLGDEIHKKRGEIAVKKSEICNLKSDDTDLEHSNNVVTEEHEQGDGGAGPVQVFLDGTNDNDSKNVPLASGTIILKVLTYIKNNPGCTANDITANVTRRPQCSESSELFYRGFVRRDDEGRLFFISWVGIRSKDYKGSRPSLLSKRQITGLITGIIQESSALSTAKIASRVGVSANCALVHLRRMEEYGSVEHNGDLWNSPGMMDVVEQSNDKVSSDEIC